MKKIYHLSSCNTCQRIIKELGGESEFELQNIKEKHINKTTLAKMAKQEGSYEALFNRRAMKYRSMGLNEMELTEKDYQKYILEEYTFVKRPVVVIDDHFYIGNSKKVVQAAKEALDQ